MQEGDALDWTAFEQACLKGSSDLLPDSCRDWWQSAEVLENFPTSNGHNKFFYGYKALFHPRIQALIESRTLLMEHTLPVFDRTTMLPAGMELKYTETRKCVNCNKAFFGKDGRLRWGAIVLPCSNSGKTLRVDRCVQCKVIQWMVEGAMRTKLREKPHWPPVDDWRHPGYAPCSHCYRRDCRNNWYLTDIYKVPVDESPPEKKPKKKE